MRRIVNVLLMLCLPVVVLSTEVSQQQAKDKACAFMQQLQGRRAQALGHDVSRNMQLVEMGLQSLYAFNCEGGGYVIVSGDDATTPILGYSPDGTLNVDEMPANLRTWLEGYADQIRRLQRGEAKAATRRAPVARAKIEPLVKAQWNQREPFNWECPKDMEAGGVTSASGCVATAMSQVMFFHKWPQEATTPYTTIGKKDVPSTTFDWDNMLPVYEEGKYTEAQGNAVAHLMRWAGWSVDMQYAAVMSGAATGRIERAMRLCFGYDKNVHWVNYGDYSLDGWEELIYNELANRRPVIYNGYNSNHEGHSFICDGYEDGKYHFNWGWGGKADGFFEIRVLEPSFSGTGGSTVNLSWSDLNDATIGIQKPTDDAAIDYPPCTETNEGLFVWGPMELTRNSTKEAFPRLRIHFYVSGAASATLNQWAYRYALLKGDRIHCMLWGGRNRIESNMVDLITRCNFSVVLPDTLSDGEYRMVPMLETGQEPTIKDVLPNSKRNYISVKVEGTKLTLKNYPEVHLEVTNPRKTFFEDDGAVNTITFSVKNTGQEEYIGYINLYKPETQVVWSYERVRLYPGETRDIKVTSRGKKTQGYFKLLQYTFTHLTINGKYIDNEKKIIKGNQLKASVSVTNSTDAEFRKFGEFLILNADSLYEEVSLHRKEMALGAGQTYAAEGETTIDAKWKKVVFSFRFKHDGFINDEIFTDVYTVHTSNPRPAGLDEALVVSNTDNMLIFNTAYDAFLTKEAIPTFVAEAGIQHTFTAEETNCWLPLAFPYNNLMGDEVKDVATGEDVTSKIKFYSLSTDLQDSGISQGQIQVKADDGRQDFCLLRVDPSLAGKTVRFTYGNLNTSLFQKVLSSSLNVYNNYCRQTKQNVYVVEGNRFVLKQSIELKPFTQYLQLAEGVENPPAYLTIVDVNNPSGIDELRSQKANDPEIYYDLQGRRLNGKPQRGLYIKNGKKTIVQ